MAYKKDLLPAPPRYCRCGTRLARDNRDAECSPCQVSAAMRVAEASEAVVKRKARERLSREMLSLEDVPITTVYDRQPPQIIQKIVYHFAKTGDYDLTADACELSTHSVRRALRRVAARSVIDVMIEDGTWPEGASKGKSR